MIKTLSDAPQLKAKLLEITGLTPLSNDEQIVDGFLKLSAHSKNLMAATGTTSVESAHAVVETWMRKQTNPAQALPNLNAASAAPAYAPPAATAPDPYPAERRAAYKDQSDQMSAQKASDARHKAELAAFRATGTVSLNAADRDAIRSLGVTEAQQLKFKRMAFEQEID